MEQTGMRWRIAGAQAVLSLRALYVNDEWEPFHADRIRAEQRKLYPYKKHLPAILNCEANAIRRLQTKWFPGRRQEAMDCSGRQLPRRWRIPIHHATDGMELRVSRSLSP